MKPIGGYFELVHGNTPLYYDDGIYLNICRNAIRYLIRALGIKRIHIPYYTCNVVADAISIEDCEIKKYSIGKDLLPTSEFPKNDFIIYTNYFGVVGKNLDSLSSIYPNLIADNAQAFYSSPNCRASVYSPRKFFGLPDGGILRGKDIPVLELKRGHSIDVMSHLLKRIDYGAQAGYNDFVENDSKLDEYPLARMSNLTRAIMGSIDYETPRLKRLENFNYLKNNLGTSFPIDMSQDDVPLVFPYLIENGSDLRNRLIRQNIFCARYWPNVTKDVSAKTFEYHLTSNVVSIPVDQRYDLKDMEYIVQIIKNG